MKAITSMTVGILVAGFGFMLSKTAYDTADLGASEDAKLACVWITYCGEPELYSPVPQPKERKTKTQDTKDSKLT